MDGHQVLLLQEQQQTAHQTLSLRMKHIKIFFLALLTLRTLKCLAPNTTNIQTLFVPIKVL